MDHTPASAETRTGVSGRVIAWLKASRPTSALGPWLTRLVEAGTQGYPPETKRRLKILNMIAYLIVLTTLVYAIQQTFLDYARYWPIIHINLAIIAVMLAVPFMHRFGPVAAALLILVTECAALLAFTSFLGRESGLHVQYVAFSAAAFVVYGLHRTWLIFSSIAVALVLHILAWFWFPSTAALIATEQDVLDSMYIQAAVTTFGIIAAAVYYAFRLAENAKAETDALLRNILPDTVVERLKAKPAEPVADTFPEASILFADITGFVPLARKLGATDTVALLNTLVSRFDELAERHGVEKIKTIGDAYMVAAGVPEPVPKSAERLARMALSMHAAVAALRAETGHALDMRMGLATGPVMAGVIGRRKFSYDIWGDAVNLAARLETASLPGRIHICPVTHERLADAFDTEPRGAMEIKGVGTQSTWFLVGPRSSI
ncbi:guanylate cyclase [Hyphomicrobium nitrativorans NL23]|uniref:Guanylate cyclase n=1 Tax=Hyphomicrobium nitrativorans NL23 TaxID=1029756 RepID=V5SB69_9HYPH|nr:adenylate/guanylate cyclase domain-containing protein [Hyphomicrobium nitrativorans]AHB47189.1 guanylate cyclase [Hyphomicrobium nitrativorans NL23]